MSRYLAVFCGFVLAFSLALTHATEYKHEAPIPAKGYQHDRYVTLPRDQMVFRGAFTASFDGPDDDDGDGKPDFRGIPEWVSYEIKKFPRKLKTGPDRPSPWITDADLFKKGIAPSDKTYAYPQAFLKLNKNWYERGHLCAKVHAWRLGKEADWNTHTVFNAVPQRKAFNAGIWKDLETRSAKWADKHKSVWVISGPIFKNRKPSQFLGEGSDMRIAIPDALFKIVIRQPDDAAAPEILAFIYEQECDACISQRGPFDHTKYLVSVLDVERQTGLSFFNSLPANDRALVMKRPRAVDLWD